jgi:hypothetical protein
MVDALGSDQAEESSGKKPNFIGQVVHSEYQDDDNQMKEEYIGDDETREDYFEYLYEIEVLEVLSEESKDWDNLSEFSVKITNNFDSKWMFFLGHLENIHGKLGDNGIESYGDIGEFLEGRVYEFREVNWEEDEEFTWEESPDERAKRIDRIFADSDNMPNNMIVPVREVDPDEALDAGAEPSPDDDDVEEVDL